VAVKTLLGYPINSDWLTVLNSPASQTSVGRQHRQQMSLFPLFFAVA